MSSKELWRASLHDFNNLLAGIQGVLDLSDPRQPLSPRNRMRLEASLEDGKTLVAMVRGMALGRWPDTGQVPWLEWKQGLELRLDHLSIIYGCPVEVVRLDNPTEDSWPSPLLQDWAAAFSRQILPWIAPGTLRLEVERSLDGWVIRWPGAPPIPINLQPDPPADAALNVMALWVRTMTERMHITLEAAEGLITARIPEAHA